MKLNLEYSKRKHLICILIFANYAKYRLIRDKLTMQAVYLFDKKNQKKPINW